MKPESFEGLCPVCGEYSEVNVDENGCCNSGVYSQGGLVTIETVEENIIENKEL